MTCYLLAGGGTAGHVNPLLALADHILRNEPDAEILVLGTKEGLESRLVPERGYELKTIERLPFPRTVNTYALTFLRRFRNAVTQVRTLIAERHVDVVVGFGGYASAPAYLAAKKAHVPIVIHEANAVVGLANKLGARHAARIAVTFSGTPLRNARVTGMPLRPEIEHLDIHATQSIARKHFGLDIDRPTLLVTGGSLGSRTLNSAVSECAQHIIDAGAQILHIWGGLTDITAPSIAGYRVLQYCDRMDLALAACDLAISRAGSTTVSEMSALGVPAIFVPYPVGNGEQRLNARDVVNAGGALLVEDQQFNADWVRQHVTGLLTDSAKLAEMSRNARRVGVLDGTRQLYDLVRQAIAECDSANPGSTQASQKE